MNSRAVKGQGSFKENPDGTITYRKGVGLKDDGKRKTLTVTAANRSICMRLMKEKEAAWLRKKNRTTISPRDTVEDLCTRHLEFQINNGELKPKSVDRREVTIKNQLAGYPIGHLQIQALTSANVDEHINRLIKEGLSVSSVNKVLDVINAAYDWGVSRGELDENPVLPIKKSIKRRLSKIETKNANEADVIVLSRDEEQEFIRECMRKYPNGNYRYPGGLFGCLLLHTGMRIGELISLRWSDYDQESGLLSINKSTSVIKNRNKKDGEKNYISVQGTTKNQKARLLQLTDEAKTDLANIRNRMSGMPGDLICRTKNGNPYTATMVEHCMSTIYKQLSFDAQISGLHILRRTFATRMYEDGAGVKEIAAYIGDLESTTMQYYIAARKKITVGTGTKQIVPVPGKGAGKRVNGKG